MAHSSSWAFLSNLSLPNPKFRWHDNHNDDDDEQDDAQLQHIKIGNEDVHQILNHVGQYQNVNGDILTSMNQMQQYPNPKESHATVTIEARISLSLVRAAGMELAQVVDELGHPPELVVLQLRLKELEQALVKLDQWRAKHEQTFTDASQTSENVQDMDSPARRLFLAEIAVLLVTPYVHRLLTLADRRGGVFDLSPDSYPLSPDRERARAMNFANISQEYATRYEGVCLSKLVGALKTHLERKPWCSNCCCSSIESSPRPLPAKLQGDARVLASRFFGAVVCLEMIMDLTGREDDDLVLERAVGAHSRLEVDGVVERAAMYDRDKAKKNLASFTSWVLSANAVVDAGYYRSSLLGKFCGSLSAALYYAIDWKGAEHRGQVCYTGSREEIEQKLGFARFVWNLPEMSAIRGFYALGLPRIKVDYEFFIPPWPKPGGLELEGGDDPIHARVISDFKLLKLPKITTKEAACSYEWTTTTTRNGEVLENGMEFIRTPLLSQHGPSSNSYSAASTNHSQSPKLPTTLIVHFHGGGFISMSSYAHENYTRIWARETGAVIVSVDYRLAPQFKFPYAFNDAYRSYRFVVEQCESLFGFYPLVVLVAGDSAGGNLAASVATRLVMDGGRVPDGVLLAYPALDLRRGFSPSFLWSIEDRLVPFVFLEACMAAYLHPDPAKASIVALDPRCSPALAPEWALAKLPKTLIVCGDADPLYDQCVRYAHHLARLGGNVRLRVYEGMIHGFLSFSWPVVGVPEVRTCIFDTCLLLKELEANAFASNGVMEQGLARNAALHLGLSPRKSF